MSCRLLLEASYLRLRVHTEIVELKENKKQKRKFQIKSFFRCKQSACENPDIEDRLPELKKVIINTKPVCTRVLKAYYNHLQKCRNFSEDTLKMTSYHNSTSLMCL